MQSIKSTIVRKAAKHTAHGTVSKLRRDPIRAAALLGAGALVGALAGWTAGRSAAPSAG
jgi:hypothetical protein